MKKIIVLAIVIVCMCGCGKKEINNPIDNTEQKQIESNASIGDLNFELIDTKIENGTSEFTFEITNTSNESKYIKSMNAIAKDNEGNEIITLLGVLEEEIGSGEKTTITCSYGGDLSNVETFEYELID